MSKWIELQKILIDETNANWDSRELAYLEHAYNTCEELWKTEVSKVRLPKLIVIGEAPLFGTNGKYIYSPSVPQSSFLFASDFPEGSIPSNLPPLQKKKILLERLAQNGVIIIDAFPYALNPVSTPTLHFRQGKNGMKPSLYKRLLKRVFHAHTAAKLKTGLTKENNVEIAVRYTRTYDAIAEALISENLKAPWEISKQGGGIDRKKFRNLLR